jgi:hypothetical protein
MRVVEDDRFTRDYHHFLLAGVAQDHLLRSPVHAVGERNRTAQTVNFRKYYCVINYECPKKDNRGVGSATLGQSWCEVWRWSLDYAARPACDEPRGWKSAGISGPRSSSRPARAEGEKRFRSDTRNP